MVPRVLLLISAKSCSLLRLARPARLLRLHIVCPASSGDGSSISRSRSPPSSCLFPTFPRRPMPCLLRLPSPRVCPALFCASFCFVITDVRPLQALGAAPFFLQAPSQPPLSSPISLDVARAVEAENTGRPHVGRRQDTGPADAVSARRGSRRESGRRKRNQNLPLFFS